MGDKRRGVLLTGYVYANPVETDSAAKHPAVQPNPKRQEARLSTRPTDQSQRSSATPRLGVVDEVPQIGDRFPAPELRFVLGDPYDDEAEAVVVAQRRLTVDT